MPCAKMKGGYTHELILAFVHFGDEPDEGVAASGIGHDYNSKHY
jgi:hypothetical protein